MGMRRQARFPLLGIILGNAFLMSVIYLALGVLVDGLRRLWPHPALVAFSERLDDLPTTALRYSGLWSDLRLLYVHEEVPTWVLRVVYGLTTVTIIFALAFVTGAALGVVRWVMLRRRA